MGKALMRSFKKCPKCSGYMVKKNFFLGKSPKMCYECYIKLTKEEYKEIYNENSTR